VDVLWKLDKCMRTCAMCICGQTFNSAQQCDLAFPHFSSAAFPLRVCVCEECVCLDFRLAKFVYTFFSRPLLSNS